MLTGAGHPELTVYAAFGAFAALFGRHSDYAARFAVQSRAGLAMVVSVFVGTVVGVVAPASFLAVVALALLSAAGLVLSRRRGILPVPSLFMVFAAGSNAAFPHTPIDLLWGAVLPLGACVVAVGIGQLGRFLPSDGAVKRPLPDVVPFRSLLAAPGFRLAVVRYLAGPLIAGGIATAVGIGHPYWAAVAATVPLAGTTLGSQLGRGTQRFVGTLLGLLVAVALLAFSPPVFVLVLSVAVFQVWAELLAMRNYALMTIGVTPLALVMVRLGSPVPLHQLVQDRLVETVIGTLVAVAVLVVSRLRRPARARRGADRPQ